MSSSPPTPEIDLAAIAVDSPDAGRPRAHRPALRVRREPLFLSPHLSLSRVPCSRCPASARSRRPPWPASSVPPSTSASRSSSMCSCCLVATACALRSLERELQPHARAIPNSGRRPSGRRRRYRPSPVKQRAPQDAREPGLRVGALRRAIGRRSDDSAALRRVQASPATNRRRV